MCAVEWKKLGDVIQVLRGRRLTKTELLEEGQYPVFHGGLEPLGYYNLSNREADSVMVINVGASAGTVGYCESDFWSSDGCFTLSKNPLLLPKYIFCYLKQEERKIASKVRKAGIPTLDAKVIEDINIPLIDVQRQEEIVSHLDTFIILISNLESELDMRRKQYEHYRNQLLDFEGVEGVEWKTLGENVQVLRGRRLTKSDLLQEGKYQVFHGGLEPLGYYNLNNREADSVMIINVGASAGTVGYCNKDFWSSDGCFTLSKNPLLLPKYLYCYLKQQERKISSKVRKAGIPTLDAKVIEDINIPLIPLAKQTEIVSKLDAFENLIQSLEQEIKLRKQQYEYYREKLLTFEKE